MNKDDNYTDPEDLFGRLDADGDQHEGLDDFEKEALEGFAMLGDRGKAEGAYDEVLKRLARHEALQPKEAPRRKAIWWYSAAAGLALIILLSVFWFTSSKDEIGTGLAMNQATMKDPVQEETHAETETTKRSDSMATPMATSQKQVAIASESTDMTVSANQVPVMEEKAVLADEVQVADNDQSKWKSTNTVSIGASTYTTSGASAYTWTSGYSSQNTPTLNSAIVNGTSVNGNSAYQQDYYSPTVNGTSGLINTNPGTYDIKTKAGETRSVTNGLAKDGFAKARIENKPKETADRKKTDGAEFENSDAEAKISYKREETDAVTVATGKNDLAKIPPVTLEETEVVSQKKRGRYSETAASSDKRASTANKELAGKRNDLKSKADTIFCETPIAYYEGGEKALQKVLLKEFAKRHPGQSLSGSYEVKGRVDTKGVLSVLSITGTAPDCADCKAKLQAILQGMKGWHVADADGELVSSEPVFGLSF